MKTIVLLPCQASKAAKAGIPEDLYIGHNFPWYLKWARQAKADKIFVITSKYGLVKLDEKIAPYNQHIKEFDEEYKNIWAGRVITRLESEGVDISRDYFIIFLGKEYREWLLPYFRHYVVPLQHLRVAWQRAIVQKWIREKLPLNQVKIVDGPQFKMRTGYMDSLIQRGFSIKTATIMVCDRFKLPKKKYISIIEKVIRKRLGEKK